MNNVFKAIQLVFRLDKKSFVINYGIFTLESLSFVASIWAMQMVLEQIARYLQSETSAKTVIAYLLFFTLIKILIYVLRSYMGYYCEYYDLSLRQRIEKTTQDKEIAPICYEDKEFLDLLSQAQIGKNRIVAITNAYIDIVFMYGLNFLFLAIYLFYLNKTLILILALAIALQILHGRFERKVEKELEEKIKNIRRKRDYFVELFAKRESVKEIYALGNHDFFRNKLGEILDKLYESGEKFYRKLLNNDLRMGIGRAITFSVCFALIFWKRNELTLSEYAVLFVTMNSILSLMEEGFYTRLKRVNSDIVYLDAYFKFMESDFEAEKMEFGDEIRLKNVSFRYPNAESYALQNIDLCIRPDEKIGVVGVNGSGKSTLSKLILQMYEPSEGEIQSLPSSAVFQDFVKYELSTLENIQISDFEKEVEASLIDEIAFGESQDADYNKVLSKQFSDKDISQGQWQKLAILRGLHKNSDFLVFDEPTWAIDPIVEKKVFDFIYEKSKRGMLVVTHRLSLIKKMDRIIVLDKGRLIGYDTHDNLLKSNEHYKMLWEANL
ncbi:MAG: ATP-binding cassette domain-containing protein [Peptostreptococcaceae bacterium]|nr:ATP-binding cassette domain-containing protein [Peptostreptococcaceae bacterium]